MITNRNKADKKLTDGQKELDERRRRAGEFQAALMAANQAMQQQARK